VWTRGKEEGSPTMRWIFGAHTDDCLTAYKVSWKDAWAKLDVFGHTGKNKEKGKRGR